MTKNAINRMRALIDGAIKQMRHTGLADDPASNARAEVLPEVCKPQK